MATTARRRTSNRVDRPTVARFRQAIVAAAVRIRNAADGQGRSLLKRRQGDEWVDEAWIYRDAVPQIMFASRFFGSANSRLRFYPGVEFEGDVVEVEDAAAPRQDGNEEAAAILSPAFAAIIREEFDRLAQSADGLPGLQADGAQNLSIGGEVYLVGVTVTADDEDDTRERWFMLSRACVKEADPDSGVYTVKDPDSGEDIPVDTRDGGGGFVARIWRRHPRYPWRPDSNVRSILDLCEEYLIINRSMRGIARSRTPAGILKVADELDIIPTAPPPLPEPSEDDEDPPDPDDDPPPEGLTDFQRSLIEDVISATEDDGSPASVAPFMAAGPAEALKDGLDWLDFGRKIDPAVLQRLEFIVRNMAQGLDLPVEVLTGMADANHWTGWLIEDSTYKAHIEPGAQLLATGIASAFLRPAIIERGVPAEVAATVTIGIDPSDLVVRPNRFADAQAVFGEWGLSWEALRRYGGFEESDAPDQDELLLRYTLQRSIGGMSLTRDLFNETGFEGIPDAAEAVEEATEAAAEGEGVQPVGGGDDTSGEDGGSPTPSEPQGPEASVTRRALAVVAAAGNAQTDIGQRLAAIDVRLRERLQAAASAALAAALARAGQRLRAAVQGDPAMAQRTKGVDNTEVGSVVGEGVVDAAELIGADDFAGLHDQWDAWTAQAATEGLAIVRAEAERRQIPAELEAGSDDEDRGAGWALLIASLLTLGQSRIFTPDATPDDGEFDPNLAVPAGPVREALTVAGGGQLPNAGAATGGPASGANNLRRLQRLGAYVVAWRWDVGLPTRPFPPHQALSGLVVTSLDDPRLLSGSWPASGGFLRPGDHRGCQCDLLPLVVFDPEAALPVSA